MKRKYRDGLKKDNSPKRKKLQSEEQKLSRKTREAECNKFRNLKKKPENRLIEEEKDFLKKREENKAQGLNFNGAERKTGWRGKHKDTSNMGKHLKNPEIRKKIEEWQKSENFKKKLKKDGTARKKWSEEARKKRSEKAKKDGAGKWLLTEENQLKAKIARKKRNDSKKLDKNSKNLKNDNSAKNTKNNTKNLSNFSPAKSSLSIDGLANSSQDIINGDSKSFDSDADESFDAEDSDDGDGIFSKIKPNKNSVANNKKNSTSNGKRPRLNTDDTEFDFNPQKRSGKKLDQIKRTSTYAPNQKEKELARTNNDKDDILQESPEASKSSVDPSESVESSLIVDNDNIGSFSKGTLDRLDALDGNVTRRSQQ